MLRENRERGLGNRGQGNPGRGNQRRGNRGPRNPRIDVKLNKYDFKKVLININQINGSNNICGLLIDSIDTYGTQRFGLLTYIAPTTNIRFIKNNNGKFLGIHYNQHRYRYRIDGFCKIIEILDTYFSNNVEIKIEIHNTNTNIPLELDLEPNGFAYNCLTRTNFNYIDIEKEIYNLDIIRYNNNPIRNNIDINENNIYNYNTKNFIRKSI